MFYKWLLQQEICYKICASCAKQENNMNNNNMEKRAIPIMNHHDIVVHDLIANVSGMLLLVFQTIKTLENV